MLRWQTRADRSHVNWAILDSEWEGEFCRVAEDHPKVLAYVKNQGLGFEVPYLYGSETERYRGEDAKEKKSTMLTYWVPGVNHLATHGRWAFAEFGEVYRIESEFKGKVEAEFQRVLAGVVSPS